MVDEEDDWLTSLSWHSHKSGRHTYLCTSMTSDFHVMLYVLLLPGAALLGNRGVAIDVDHLDGDSLNNRRMNLRYLTHRDNIAAGFARLRRERRVNGDATEHLGVRGQE